MYSREESGIAEGGEPSARLRRDVEGIKCSIADEVYAAALSDEAALYVRQPRRPSKLSRPDDAPAIGAKLATSCRHALERSFVLD